MVEANSIDTVSATFSPTIRQIIASNNQLPKGTYTDSNGQKFTIKNLQRRQAHFNDFYVNANTTL